MDGRKDGQTNGQTEPTKTIYPLAYFVFRVYNKRTTYPYLYIQTAQRKIVLISKIHLFQIFYFVFNMKIIILALKI